MKRRIAAIVLAIPCAACAGGGTSSAPAPDPMLMYGMPVVNPLTYTMADTVQIDLDIAGTSVQINVRSDATLEAGFVQVAADAMEALIRYTDISGSFTNSMGPPTSISASDIPGPARIRVASDGDVSVLELPESTEAFQQVFGSEGAYRRLFVQLPGRAVQPGTMWTDTVAYTETMGTMTTETNQIVTSTLVGDTLTGNRRLLVITSDIEGSTRIAGSNQGMEFIQHIAGTSNAVTLWDPARRAIVERSESGTSEGTMEMPAMGMTGLPLSLSSTSVVRLEEN